MESYCDASIRIYTNTILTIISEGLAEQNIECSVEQLGQMIENSGRKSLSSSVTLDKKKKKVTKPRRTEEQSPISTVQCSYLFQRGDRRYKQCSEPAVSGTAYCKLCLKKRSVKMLLDKKPSSPGPSSSKMTKYVDNLVSLPEDEQILEMEPDDTLTYDLTGQDLPDQPNTYRLSLRNFIAKKIPHCETLIVYGTQEDNDSEILPLTEEDIEIAKANGLEIGVEIEDTE